MKLFDGFTITGPDALADGGEIVALVEKGIPLDIVINEINYTSATRCTRKREIVMNKRQQTITTNAPTTNLLHS